MKKIHFAKPESDTKIRIGYSDGLDGVYMESQRGTETAWTSLGNDMLSPFVDTRAPLVAGQAEQRKYRLQFLDGDTPVGVWSDIIVVSTTP